MKEKSLIKPQFYAKLAQVNDHPGGGGLCFFAIGCKNKSTSVLYLLRL